ncbi:nucleoside recognition domain-containing protein [Verrucomicrobiales bacterium BCK34]|nr:nucleoside recognition domain-containing protein [Verrucomicrobiales bacterium BCK34]
MLNWIWMGMIVIGVVVAALLDQLSGANGIVEGMFSMIKVGVVNIVIPLSAVMMLWLGIMRLAEKSGMIQVVSRAVRPVMKRLFPDVPSDHPAMSAMVMNMAANMLGLGNAATPLGLKAMQHLDDLNPNKGTATNAMCTFLAINTSSVTLIPATAIGLLAAQGIAEPYAIVGTTIGATLVSTTVAIIAVKLLEKLPVFNREAVPEEVVEEEANAKEEVSRKLSGRGKAVVAVVLLMFAGIVYLETFPEQRVRLQEALGLREVAIQLDAETPTLDEVKPEGEDPLWQRTVSAISVAAIPFVLVFFIVFAALKRIPVYEEFVEGAKEGWQVAVRIMPFIVAMLAALAMLRNSGALFLFQNLLRPVLEFVHFPAELVPMALMRPLSGSGSQGVLVEILTNEGLSETLKYTAATMFGSTETTFYVLAVYFGSVAVRRTRHALAAGLTADLAGVIAAVVICRAMFG